MSPTRVTRLPLTALLLLAGCSENPLDPDEVGCLRGPEGSNTCDETDETGGNGNGNGNGNSNDASVRTRCDAVCQNLATCGFLAVSAAECLTGCVADPPTEEGFQCLENGAAQGSCDALAQCLGATG
jgi:hypothetical protein